jgi:signal transduction histidine kinase/CheY-like chemotaxis protein
VDYEQMTKGELVEELSALDSAITYFVFDRNGGVRDANANAVALLGLERRALVGKPFTRFLEEADAPLFADHLRSVVESDEKCSIEIRIRTAAEPKRIRFESVRAGGPRHAVTIIRSIASDCSERQSLEDQLRQAQRMEAIARLAGGIAHDFNNLLMAILGHAEILLLRLPATDPARPNIETIQDTAERAAALTRQLVTFSRKQVIAPRVLDLNAVVSDMDKILRRLIGEDVELVYRLDPEVGRFKADAGQVEQVILNLAVNARDAMPKGGQITIATRNADVDEAHARHLHDVKPGGYVELVVTDTGVGMDSDTQAHIFEPFFTTKVQGKGTGLGLSTVYGIVRQSGGHIQVTSAPGHGTTFEIRFPRVDEAASVRHADASNADLPRGTETVLVVEDEDSVRELVRDMLQMVGYTVVEARHGGEALLLCERFDGPIHLMVTDVVMPQMSGRQLAERLAPLRPEMKVLFMSGHTDDAVIRHGVKNAIMTFIQKPFTPAAIARQVRAILDGG